MIYIDRAVLDFSKLNQTASIENFTKIQNFLQKNFAFSEIFEKSKNEQKSGNKSKNMRMKISKI